MVMTVRPYGNKIFTDVFIDLLEQPVLFLSVRFQQYIVEVIFQYPYALCPVGHHFMFPVALFFIQFRLCIADDVFRKVTDIDCTVNILQ